ncbi:hypothetical protein AVEN_175318-1 [Araneus ventricosus]|uniref:Uncharacterized protein n=1 Tax=Araneus ventricosus TaxID=182803 RepID=A0A4Y2GDS7_ARAVE|nr:hypothetical protein AVEN_175318-1 [Araneus ventricosus]
MTLNASGLSEDVPLRKWGKGYDIAPVTIVKMSKSRQGKGNPIKRQEGHQPAAALDTIKFGELVLNAISIVGNVLNETAVPCKFRSDISKAAFGRGHFARNE